MLKRDKIIAYLLEKGCKEVTSRSQYRQFTRPGKESFYFVGQSGALRTGKNASSSISLMHIIKRGGIIL